MSRGQLLADISATRASLYWYGDFSRLSALALSDMVNTLLSPHAAEVYRKRETADALPHLRR